MNRKEREVGSNCGAEESGGQYTNDCTRLIRFQFINTIQWVLIGIDY